MRMAFRTLRSGPKSPPRFRRGLLLFGLAVVPLLGSQCTKSPKKPELSTALDEAARAAEPLAMLASSGLAMKVASGNPATRSIEEVLDGLRPESIEVSDALCGSLAATVKEFPSKSRSENASLLRMSSQRVVSDIFVLNLVREAFEGPSDRRGSVLSALALDADPPGAPAEPVAMLRGATLLGSDGRPALPRRGSAEYVKFSDWLGNHPAFIGIVTKLSMPLTDGIRDCRLF